MRATEFGDKPDQMVFEYVTKTDSEGRFEFSKVPGGSAQIFVPALQNRQATNNAVQDIQVEAGQTVSVSLSVVTQ